MEVVWSRLAKETLVDILNYVESNYGRIVATKVYDRINRHVESLVFSVLDNRRSPMAIDKIVSDFIESNAK